LLNLLAVGSFAQSSKVLTVEEVIKAAVTASPKIKGGEAERANVEKLYASSATLFPSRPEMEAGLETERVFGGRDYTYTIGISQEIEIGGQRSLRQQAISRRILYAESAIKATRQRVSIQAQLLYNRVWALTNQVELGNKLIAASNRLTEASKRRLSAGDISTLEYNSVALESNRQKMLHEKLHAAQEEAIAELTALTGLPIAEYQLAEDLSFQAPTQDSLQFLFEANPEWKALQARIGQLESERDLARASQIPNLRAGLSYTSGISTIEGSEIHYATGFPSSIDQIQTKEQALGINLGIAIPITIPGLWSGNPTEEIEKQIALSQLQAQQQQLERELTAKGSVLLPRINRIKQAIKIFDESNILIGENSELLERGYLAGELGLAELLTGRQQLIEIQTEHLELARELRESEIELSNLFIK